MSTYTTENLKYEGDLSKSGTSKGTILVNDASIFNLLTVGSNGTVLTANSLESTGLEWASSGGAERGLVTVGATDADYTTIALAYADGKDNIRVITDISETVAIDLSVGPNHLRIEINPGVTVAWIAAAVDWFTGNNTLLTIVGGGAHMDLTTIGLSSRITLQPGQTFRSGTNAELQVTGVRYTGSGTNVLLGGSSLINNCRFDGATRFDLDLFEQYIHVTKCLFTVPVQLDSLTGTDQKSAIVTNNIFINGAHVTIDGVDDLVFTNNTLGRTAAANFTISGTSCTGALISDNSFEFSELTISATTLNNVTISDNIWARDTIDGVTISSTCDNIIVSNNVFDHVTINSTLTDSTIQGNTANDDITVTGVLTRSTISNNVTGDSIILGAVSTSNISGNISTGTLTCTSCIDSYISGNTYSSMTFSTTTTTSTISNNVATVGAIILTGDCLNSIVSGNNCSSVLRFSANSTGTAISENIVLSGDLDIMGNCVTTAITGNVLEGGITVDGLTTNSSITGNVCTGNTGRFIFTGTSSGDIVSNNQMSQLITFTGLIIDCCINNNKCRRILLDNIGINDTSTIGNNVATGGGIGLIVTGSCRDMTISGNTLEAGITISGTTADTSIIGNVCAGNSSNFIFTGNATRSVISSNHLVQNITFTGLIIDCCINGNHFQRILLNNAGINDTSTISGNASPGGGVGLVVTGSCRDMAITGNVFQEGMTVAGTTQDSTITGNLCAGNNSVFTFTGNATGSTISNNQVVLAITFTGRIQDCSINNNKCRTIVLADAGTNNTSTISGNVTTVSTLAITGSCNAVSITGNSFQTGITVGGTLLETAITGNSGEIASPISVVGICTEVTITGNIASNILLDTGGTGTCTRMTIIGNTLTGAITIGTGGGSSLSDSIINGNYAPTGTTTAGSGGTNIVTSNRNGGTTTGFGGGDVIANNL